MEERDCLECGESWTCNRRNRLYKVTTTKDTGPYASAFFCSECITGDLFLFDLVEGEDDFLGCTIRVELYDEATDAIERRRG